MLSKTMSPQQFLDQFESQIIQYSEQHPNDKRYYDVLAFLYSKTNNAESLKAVDLYGWKELSLEHYASSYVVRLNPKSEEFQRALNEALNDFPASPTLNEIHSLSLQPQYRKYAMAKFVATKFENLKTQSKSKYRLDDYMASLENKIKELENQGLPTR